MLKALDKRWNLHFLHRTFILSCARHVAPLLVRMTELRVRVATPREAVTWLILTSCCYYKRLVTATDNFLNAELFQCLHLLRQRIFDHSPAASMEAAATNLATFLL